MSFKFKNFNFLKILKFPTQELEVSYTYLNFLEILKFPVKHKIKRIRSQLYM